MSDLLLRIAMLMLVIDNLLLSRRLREHEGYIYAIAAWICDKDTELQD